MEEAKVLNEIERKLRKGEEVTDKEISLLIGGYYVFKCCIPNDIKNKLGLN